MDCTFWVSPLCTSVTGAVGDGGESIPRLHTPGMLKQAAGVRETGVEEPAVDFEPAWVA